MKDPLDQIRQNAKALDLFRKALDHSAPVEGLEQVRLKTHGELACLRKFHNGVCVPHRKWLLPAAVAVIALGGAAFLFLPAAGEFHSSVVCPHGGTDLKLNWRRVPASVQHKFLGNPDRFQRICHCTPKYSGNLRGP